MSPPLVPLLDQEIHFVLCQFGKQGRAYVETDPGQADREIIVRNLITGEYDHPVSVMACNLAEGWARDVSESIAREVAKTDGDLLPAGTRAFIDRLLTRSAGG